MKIRIIAIAFIALLTLIAPATANAAPNVKGIGPSFVYQAIHQGSDGCIVFRGVGSEPLVAPAHNVHCTNIWFGVVGHNKYDLKNIRGHCLRGSTSGKAIEEQGCPWGSDANYVWQLGGNYPDQTFTNVGTNDGRVLGCWGDAIKYSYPLENDNPQTNFYDGWDIPIELHRHA